MIRAATEKDIPRIIEIKRLTVPLLRAGGNPQWSDDYPGEKDFMRDIELNGLFVYDDGDDVKAFLSIAKDDSELFRSLPFSPCKNPITLHRTAVAPEARGKGVGKMLFEFAQEEAKRRGCDMILSDTHETNKPMNALMRLMGYRLVCGFPREGWQGLYNAYEKPL